ncbi:MAG TPA: arsenic transporter [Steroidobacteraceae bacterium]|nr:arsenic transporter [Steroidobacteraceae bacterium]
MGAASAAFAGFSAPLIWLVAVLTTLGVLLRPLGRSEAFWAVAGALVLCASGLVALPVAWASVLRGLDVYLFLAGMMLISELARKTGLFDHVAARAVRGAHGSARRLFALIYGFGTLVTVFMSNDATAVVLTPAVLAAMRAAQIRRPLPHLFACAFIANAASFVLPISNPANLVLFGSRMPPLADWLARFALPSAAAIVATFLALWLTQREALAERFDHDVPVPPLSLQGWLTAAGIVLTAIALMVASFLGSDLGWPTCVAGVATLLGVCATRRGLLWPALAEISWGVLPMVAGLFVLVGGLEQTSMIGALARELHLLSQQGSAAATGVAVVLVALACNVVNNLPAGLLVSSALSAGHASATVTGAMLVATDLGPNLSVTGSLATLLWLTALRREGLMVSAGQFLRVGLVAMPLALLPALAALFVT